MWRSVSFSLVFTTFILISLYTVSVHGEEGDYPNSSEIFADNDLKNATCEPKGICRIFYSRSATTGTIGTVDHHDSVWVLADDGEMLFIFSKGRTGWVKRKFFTLEERVYTLEDYAKDNKYAKNDLAWIRGGAVIGMFAFTVNVTPANARVRIMNIKEKYYPGIMLNVGQDYVIRVDHDGMATYEKTVNYSQSTAAYSLDVTLGKAEPTHHPRTLH